MAFGAIMLFEVVCHFVGGWIHRYYIEPNFFFTYYGFQWVKPWPGNGMYWHFEALGVLSACVMLGLCYRLSAVLLFFGFTYIFLLDQSWYLNHFYLIVLISLLMVFLPAHRAFSLDSWMRPAIHSDTAPTWTLWLLRAQIGIVYFYGGLAKLNGDWLHGEPMRMWLARRIDFPLIGQYFTEEWMVYGFVYGGLLLDLLVVPFLLWRRTRLIAFVFAFTFHLLNSFLFRIGIFPLFMSAATLLFFNPDWPRYWLELINSDPSGGLQEGDEGDEE
jgi:hypothetical protein